MVDYVSKKKVLGYLSRSSILVPKHKVYHENYNSWELDDGGREGQHSGQGYSLSPPLLSATFARKGNIDARPSIWT